MSALLGDSTHDDRVAAALEAVDRRQVSEAALRAAALVETDPSPAMLEDTARWIELRDELSGAGLSPVEILRVCLRAATGAYGGRGPGVDLMAELFTCPEGDAVARALHGELAAGGEPPPDGLQGALCAAVARLGAEGPLDASLLAGLDLGLASLALVRAIVSALPLGQREAIVLGRVEGAEPDSYRAARIVEELLALQDLAPTPAVLAARDRALAVVEEEDGRSRLEERCRAPIAPLPPASRPTQSALDALAYWLDQRTAGERAARLGPLAEARWATHNLPVEAEELASLEAWTQASDERRRSIAEAVTRAAQALEPAEGWRLVELRRFGGPPIAVLARGEEHFSLVPGGVVEVGLSDRELSLLRARAEQQAGSDNHEEQYGSLLDQVERLRPVTRVRVGALLASRDPGVVRERPAASDALAESALRVPSEAEWEHLARGGQSDQLTYRGDEVPDTTEWYFGTGHLDVDGANVFGLWGFGYEPELCADRYADDHEGLPADGSPRRGPGPRVVRGGAAQVFPWQACGEWQLLLSAMRGSEEAWQYNIALRMVLGVGGRR